MSEPYLILHKVRGEPAFDVAIKLMIGDEEGWIIPTSGHRAYPLWNIELIATDALYIDGCCILDQLPNLPTDWPDHYSPTCEKTISLPVTILNKLIEPIKRRL